MKVKTRQLIIVITTLIVVSGLWWPIQLFTGPWNVSGKILYAIFCVVAVLFGLLLFVVQDMEPHRPNKWQ